jgi:hypothetical protein
LQRRQGEFFEQRGEHGAAVIIRNMLDPRLSTGARTGLRWRARYGCVADQAGGYSRNLQRDVL